MQLGFYGFEHSYLSRAGCKVNGIRVRGKSSTRHAAAVASYMSNLNKVGSTIAVNLPTDRGELYSELSKHSAGVTRKNGRIMETFIIWFDVKMSPEHQDEALGRFLMAATFQGKTRAEGWRHVDSPHNPHAHAILIDVDENGEPVGHFSRSGTYRRTNSPVKGNPTVWLRQLWQDECNAVLEQHGYDFRIDRRSKLEQVLEKQSRARNEELIEASEKVSELLPTEQNQEAKAGVKAPDFVEVEPEESPEFRQTEGESEEPECPPMPGDAPEDDEYPDASEDSGEDVMADHTRVGFAVDMFHQWKYLEHTKAKVEFTGKLIAHAEKRLEEAQESFKGMPMARQMAHRRMLDAKRELEAFQRADGNLKGFNLSIGGKSLWKSPARQKGEKAALTFDGVNSEFIQAEKAYAEAEYELDRWKNELTHHTEQKSTLEHELQSIEQTMGDAKDLDQAEEMITQAMNRALKDITPDDLLQMVQDGLISQGQYTDALRALGTQEAQRVLHEYEQGEGQGL